MSVKQIPKVTLISVVSAFCLDSLAARASVMVDFDTKRVTRMNDNIPVLVVKENKKYSAFIDFDQSSPAGEGKAGYATQRKIKSDDVVNTNQGVNGLLLTPIVSSVSVQTSSYSAGRLREVNRNAGQVFARLDIEARRAIRNYQVVSDQFAGQKKSRSRLIGGPLYRGNFTFE